MSELKFSLFNSIFGNGWGMLLLGLVVGGGIVYAVVKSQPVQPISASYQQVPHY